jgi:hypothetical protein
VLSFSSAFSSPGTKYFSRQCKNRAAQLKRDPQRERDRANQKYSAEKRAQTQERISRRQAVIKQLNSQIAALHLSEIERRDKIVALVLLNAKFNNDNNFVGLTGGAPAGRADGRAYTTSLGSAYLGWWLSSNFQELIFGFAYYNPSTSFTNNVRMCTMADGGTNQVDVRTDATGHLFFTRNGTAIGGASTNALNAVGLPISGRANVAVPVR